MRRVLPATLLGILTLIPATSFDARAEMANCNAGTGTACTYAGLLVGGSEERLLSITCQYTQSSSSLTDLTTVTVSVEALAEGSTARSIDVSCTATSAAGDTLIAAAADAPGNVAAAANADPDWRAHAISLTCTGEVLWSDGERTEVRPHPCHPLPAPER